MLWKIIVWLFGWKNQKTHGSAQFMGYWERLRMLNRWNRGLVVDGINKLKSKVSFTHMAIIANSGAGKSSRLIAPNVLTAKNCSLAVTDPSGELLQISKGYLLKKGFEIKVLNFTNPEESDRYNPLLRCNTASEARKMAELVVDSAFDPKSTSDGYWNDSAKHLLTRKIHFKRDKTGCKVLNLLHKQTKIAL